MGHLSLHSPSTSGTGLVQELEKVGGGLKLVQPNTFSSGLYTLIFPVTGPEVTVVRPESVVPSLSFSMRTSIFGGTSNNGRSSCCCINSSNRQETTAVLPYSAKKIAKNRE